jgi:hypothetical protein
MLRITTWRQTGAPPPSLTPQTAMQTINEMCTALGKVPGAGQVRWFFGNGGIVTVGEPDSYAVADAILKTPLAQAAVAKVLALGYGLVDDQFLLEPSKVLPFIEAQETVPAQMSRN